jgi:hypothetical protein
LCINRKERRVTTTNDELIPRCIICGEEFDLEEWIAKLDSGQQFRNWLGSAVPEGGVTPTPICYRCKNEPGRTERFMDSMGDEELRRRLGVTMERHRNIAKRFEDDNADS